MSPETHSADVMRLRHLRALHWEGYFNIYLTCSASHILVVHKNSTIICENYLCPPYGVLGHLGEEK